MRRALFLSGANDADMPTTELTESQLTDGRIGILDLMLACKLAPTKSEARRLVQQGGVFADDEKVASIDVVFTGEQLKNGVKLRKGKKGLPQGCSCMLTFRTAAGPTLSM